MDGKHLVKRAAGKAILAASILGIAGCTSTGSLATPKLSKIKTSAPLRDREAYFLRMKAVGEGSTTLINGLEYRDEAARAHYRAFHAYIAAGSSLHADRYARQATRSCWVPPLIGAGGGAIVGLVWALVEGAVNGVSTTYGSGSKKSPDPATYALLGAAAGTATLGLTLTLPLSLNKVGKAREFRARAADEFNDELEDALLLTKRALDARGAGSGAEANDSAQQGPSGSGMGPIEP